MKLAICLIYAFISTFSVQASELDQVEALIKKYRVTAERPKSCPLQSRKFADLLAKTETIKNGF